MVAAAGFVKQPTAESGFNYHRQGRGWEVPRQADQRRNSFRIIGIGNPLAGDDAVGICVANKLIRLQLSGVDILLAGQAPLDILDYLEGAENAILIDAIQSGKKSGTIVRLEIPRDFVQLTSFAWTSGAPSTHMLGLGEAIALGIELEKIPPHIILYGIELGHMQMGASLSPEIVQSIETVVKHIVDDIQKRSCTNFE